MINISELKVIEDTFFKTDTTYFKPSIYSLIEKYFKEENTFSEASLVKLKNLVSGNPNFAYNKLLEEDVEKLKNNIKSTPKQFDENLWRKMLPKITEEVKKNIGLSFKTRPIFFEDKFPDGLFSFEIKGASSLTIFEGQEGAGIYFLNKRVSSLFTPIFLIHEQLHSCLSQNKTKEQIYIEWFEEGLCQWFSLKIYYELTKNIDVINAFKERSYIYSKVKDEHNFTKRYYEYMKIFSALYLRGGNKLLGKMLLNYLSNNRQFVNDQMIKEPAITRLPKTEIEKKLVNYSFALEPEKFPPIEYLILKNTLTPTPIEKIPSLVKAPDELVKGALIALQVKGMLFIKDNIVDINWRKKDLFEKDMIKPFWPM